MKSIDIDSLGLPMVSGRKNGKKYEYYDISEVPIVEAIPIWWIEKLRQNAIGRGDEIGKDMLNWLLDVWQWQEEHGDNFDKSGVWEPLGYRSGFLKHPLSEDFRCSLCGYEAYTVLSLPPDRCPRCNAELKLKQEDE